MKVKLSDAFELQMGKTPSRNSLHYWNGEHKWVSIGDLSGVGKYITQTKECISDIGVAESGIKLVPKETVIMSFKLSIGKAAITSEDMYTNEAIMAFIDKGTYSINRDYIYHLFNGMDWSEGTNKAVLGMTLNKATLAEKWIDIPNMDEQKFIVNVLDKLDSLIFLRKKQLAKLDELVKARFVEMFGDVIHNTCGWPVHTFSDIASSRLGKMLDRKQQTGRYRFPYLANFNVQWFHFEISSLNQMDFDEADQQEFALIDGDLLVCEGGEIGRCAVWHNEVQPCFFQKALHRVRCNRDIILPDYLAWWFKYNCDHGGFSAIEGAKATIAHLPGAKLKMLPVVVPPMDKQRSFSTFIEQIGKSRLTIQQSLAKLEVLKKALMQEYFG